MLPQNPNVDFPGNTFSKPLTGADDREGRTLPPLEDPYLHARSSRAKLSALALTSVAAPLLLGPLGAVAGIVFGWYARRGIEPRRQGSGLATLGMVLGIVALMLWGTGLVCVAAAVRHRNEVATLEAGETAEARVLSRRRTLLARTGETPAASVLTAPAFAVPKETTVRRVGTIIVTDVGMSAISLSEALATQRAEAASAGETMVVMTTAARCEPCRSIDRALVEPPMQTALSRFRLVRVDVGFFGDDLAALKIPFDKFPGFYLLAPALTPRDGINGGEWDEDIVRNIAPVLGAFVRGRYTSRREAWKPLPSTGMRL